MKTAPHISRSLADLTPLERQQEIKVKEAAAFNDLSEATFRRHYPHLIRKIRRAATPSSSATRSICPPPQAKTA